MGAAHGINYCCGGRAEKLQDDFRSPIAGHPMRDLDAPVRKEPPKSSGRRRAPNDSVLKKLGKSCCCGNLGEQPKSESQAPLPQSPPAEEVDMEGSPSMPKAAELAGAAFKTALRHDLNGYWLLVETQGDMDTFLAEFGRGWFYRMAASRMQFGAGVIAQHIKQDGDNMFIDRTLGSGSHVFQEFSAGGGPFESFDDLGVGMFEADWDNTGVLVIEGTLSSGHPITVRRLRYSQETLVDEITSPNGTTIAQVYGYQEC